MANGEYIVVMDADRSHPVQKIPELLETVRSGCSIFAVGSRYTEGGGFDRDWGLWRFLNSKAATMLARPLLQAKDPMSGFFAVRKRTLGNLGRFRPIGFKIALELVVRTPLAEVVEVPIVFNDRRSGKSKMNLGQQWKYLRHIRRLYSYRFGMAGEITHFILVGGSGFLVDVTIYFALQLLGVEHRVARAISFWPAVTWNWALNRRATFGDRKRRASHREWFEYILLSAVAFYLAGGYTLS